MNPSLMVLTHRKLTNGLSYNSISVAVLAVWETLSVETTLLAAEIATRRPTRIGGTLFKKVKILLQWSCLSQWQVWQHLSPGLMVSTHKPSKQSKPNGSVSVAHAVRSYANVLGNTVVCRADYVSYALYPSGTRCADFHQLLRQYRR